MKLIIISILLLFTYSTGYTIVEQSSGDIHISLSFDDPILSTAFGEYYTVNGCGSSVFTGDGRALPAQSFTLALSYNEEASVEYIPRGRPISLNRERFPLYTDFEEAVKPHLGPVVKSLTAFVESHHITVSPFREGPRGEILFYPEGDLYIRYNPVIRGRRDVSRRPGEERLFINSGDLSRMEPMIPPPSRGGVRSAARSATPVKPDETAVRFNLTAPISTSDFAETDLENGLEGIYRITYSDISALGRDIPFNDIVLLGADRFIYDRTVPTLDEMSSGVEEISYVVRDRAGDGIFREGDEILFYGGVPHRWLWANNSWEFAFNDFENIRPYWIVIRPGQGGGLNPISQPSVEGEPDRYGYRYRRVKRSSRITTADKNNEVLGNSSRRWKWHTLFSRDQFTFNLPIFDSSISDLQIRTVISLNRDGFLNLRLSGGGVDEVIQSNRAIGGWIDLPEGGRSTEMRLRVTNSRDTAYIDLWGYDLRYRRELTLLDSEQMIFFSDRSLAQRDSRSYSIDAGKQSYLLAMRVNEGSRFQPVRHELLFAGSTDGEIIVKDTDDLGFKYVVAGENSFLNIPTPQVVSLPQSAGSHIVRSPRGFMGQTDFVIVSPEELIDLADSFAVLKKLDGFNPIVLSTGDIYHEFSGGMREPAAIRNALSYMIPRYSSSIPYLLLFGGGHYDYKGRATNHPNRIPPYITAGYEQHNLAHDSQSRENAVATDDFYSIIEAETMLSRSGVNSVLIVGRATVESRRDAEIFLAKVERMSRGGDQSSDWRNRAVFLSDDDGQKGRRDYVQNHHGMSDRAASNLENLPGFYMEKVNLFEFPYGSNWNKPEARDAFIGAINRGAAYVNYYGHGSYFSITDEEVFTLADITRLTNSGRYFIFSSFSCSMSFFDMPGVRDLASSLLLSSLGGSLATVGGTRNTYASSNETSGNRFYRTLARSLEDGENSSVGYTFYKEKKQSAQFYRYILIGDPSYSPSSQRKQTTLSINGSDENFLDTLKIFDEISIDFDIPHELFNERDTVFAHIVVQNPTRDSVTRKDDFPQGHDSILYSLPGDRVHESATIAISDPSYSYRLIVPRSVKERAEGVRVNLFAWSNNLTLGATRSIFIDGVNIDGVDTTDKEGPQISARVRPSISSDSMFTATPFPDAGGTLRVDGFNIDTLFSITGDITFQERVNIDFFLYDKSGVDHYYGGAGEGITLEIPGIQPLISLNDTYQPIEGDTSGIVSYTLNKRAVPRVGEYPLIITARDILGNPREIEYTLDIRSLDDAVYKFGRIYAFPSPVHRGESTRFWFNETDATVSRTSLKIFTLDGRMVRHFRDVQSGVSWDLRDESGRLLPPNVYLYRLYAERLDRGNSGMLGGGRAKETIASPVKKIIIYPPR